MLAFMVAFSGIAPHLASAAPITSASNTMSNQTVSATSTHALSFVSPTGANQSSDNIVITFPSDFNFTGKVFGDVTLTHGPTTGAENTETIASTPSASAWGAAFSSTQNRVLTLTAPTDGVGSAAIAPGARIIVRLNASNSVNPTTPGSYVIAISGTFGDTGDITVNILSNSQVDISASVPQSLTFSISDTSVSFGNLNPSAARYASGTDAGSATEVEAHNIIVGTNAANGYTITASGTTLTSGLNTITPIGGSNTASSVGSEQFGMRFTASGGIGAVAAPYALTGFAYDTAAFPDIIASASGASANTTYSARYLANIGANTEAGNYSAVLTFIATANY